MWVSQQRFIPNDFIDYLAPPRQYFLTNLNFSTDLYLAKKPITVGASVYNLLNINYRDYMNRFRYFSDETGRNFVVRLKLNL